MKTTIASVMAVALLVTPALAQRRQQNDDKPPAKPAAPQVDEKAYKAALERIPEPKQKYDPWGGVVPSQPEKIKKKP